MKKSKETRERILEAALRVFAANGYRGTTTRDICQQAKVNGAAINYHFGSKESLWLAVCDFTQSKILEIVVANADFALPLKEAIPRFLDRSIDDFIAYPYPIKILTWLAVQAEFLDFEQTNKAFQPIAMMLTNHIKKMQKEGAFNPNADLEVALPLLYGQFVFLFNHDTGHRFLFGRDINDKEHAERVKREFTRIVMLALGLED
jgi:AcrR family transcriptional regulator